MENPLLGYFGTKHQSAPFTKIMPKHFIPAIEKDIQESLEAIDKITNQTSQPSFDNTIDALQNIGEFLERNSALLFNLNSAETTEEIQKITGSKHYFAAIHTPGTILIQERLFFQMMFM